MALPRHADQARAWRGVQGTIGDYGAANAHFERIMASSADDVDWPYWIGLHDGLQESLTGLVSSLVHPIHSRCELFRFTASHTTSPLVPPPSPHKNAFVLVVECSSHQRCNRPTWCLQDGPMEPPPTGWQAQPGRNRRRCHEIVHGLLLLLTGHAAGDGGLRVRAGTHPGAPTKSAMVGLSSRNATHLSLG
jgi:hypothetical protein